MSILKYNDFLNESFKEHDIVTINVDYKDMKKGTKGTIVHVNDESNFDVEFIVDSKSKVETITADKLNGLHKLNKYMVTFGDPKGYYSWTVFAYDDNEAKQIVIDNETFINSDNDYQLNVKLLKNNILGTNKKGIIKGKTWNDYSPYGDGKYRHLKFD